MTQATDLSKRTSQEVFMHHAQTLGAEDLDGVMLNASKRLMRGNGMIREKRRRAKKGKTDDHRYPLRASGAG
jgi:hypothetical protein